jgi:hypothetical protein
VTSSELARPDLIPAITGSRRVFEGISFMGFATGDSGVFNLPADCVLSKPEKIQIAFAGRRGRLTLIHAIAQGVL